MMPDGTSKGKEDMERNPTETRRNEESNPGLKKEETAFSAEGRRATLLLPKRHDP